MSWINILDILYPINSVYISTSSFSPSSLIGGTWVQITNAVIRASTSIGYSGSDTHKITENEMPSHTHTWRGVNDGAAVTPRAGYYPFHIYQDHDANWPVGGPTFINNTGGGLLCQFFQEFTIFMFGTGLLKTTSSIKGGVF